MNSTSRRLGKHFVASDDGWTVDTSSFWSVLYKDSSLEAKIYLDGVGTLCSPCCVGFSTMVITPLEQAPAGAVIDGSEIEKRVSTALKVLKIRFRAV